MKNLLLAWLVGLSLNVDEFFHSSLGWRIFESHQFGVFGRTYDSHYTVYLHEIYSTLSRKNTLFGVFWRTSTSAQRIANLYIVQETSTCAIANRYTMYKYIYMF